jgi:hypothetical protein
MDLRDLADAATTVVRARCSGFTSEQTSGGFPQTVARFSVLEVAKGDATTSDLAIKQPGGTINGKVIVVPGAPEFHNGEEAILFLEPKRDGGFMVVGLSQGYLPIATGSGGSPSVYVRDAGGLGLKSKSVVPVTEVLAAVRGLAAKGAK